MAGGRAGGWGGCRDGGLGGWSAKAGWGVVDGLVNLVCVTFRLRAGERRKLAAHLPPEHAVVWMENEGFRVFGIY